MKDGSEYKNSSWYKFINDLETGSLVVMGIFLVLLGVVLVSPITKVLIDIVGVVAVVAGVCIAIYGIVKYFSKPKGDQTH